MELIRSIYGRVDAECKTKLGRLGRPYLVSGGGITPHPDPPLRWGRGGVGGSAELLTRLPGEARR